MVKDESALRASGDHPPEPAIMGIKGLMPFISDHAPLAVKETEMKALTGRTIAIDACAPWPPT